MYSTRTGTFPIGFRRVWSPWQRDLPTLLAWTKQAGFSFIDLGNDADTIGQAVLDAGLKIGSADLPEWQQLLSADHAKRVAAVAKNSAYIAACAALGVRKFFIVMLPENPNLSRKENFNYLVESLNELAHKPTKEEALQIIKDEDWITEDIKDSMDISREIDKIDIDKDSIEIEESEN